MMHGQVGQTHILRSPRGRVHNLTQSLDQGGGGEIDKETNASCE